MKHPAKVSKFRSPVFSANGSIEIHFDQLENTKPDFFISDLKNSDGVMMAEIYGSDFQKVWKRTRKKWWA